ncbi:SDR family NAD(P)-dependent oxidoreductase [Sessilibacter corallicola]|uniref:SDR family oxidoreductase n=1 Tax=Sessilibacter corallicola TaxID=2904075 RepID=A0ABQ0A7H8_9GAMM|nr:SDR family NAD(P)-dependent oxidoreductase [Sessilibacter corallicola]MCE2028783.1 SDR family NAD(P)-dependent oxidoreductase [Sessilibacter corallicola]
MTFTACITGATSGFGRAAAEKFAQQGWHLLLTGRREERLKEIKEQLSQYTVVETMVLDVQDTEACKEKLSQLPPSLAPLKVLVNNAGLALGTAPAQDASLDQWHQMIDTNVKGLSTVTYVLLPKLIECGAGASIINIGSIAGLYPYPGGNVYCGTKAFVEQFSKALRCDLLGTGVRVSNVAPGMAETEFTLVRTSGNQQASDDLYKGVDAIQASDIADTLLYLANLPDHLNINELEIMPTQQAWSPFAVNRKS